MCMLEMYAERRRKLNTIKGLVSFCLVHSPLTMKLIYHDLDRQKDNHCCFVRIMHTFVTSKV